MKESFGEWTKGKKIEKHEKQSRKKTPMNLVRQCWSSVVVVVYSNFEHISNIK